LADDDAVICNTGKSDILVGHTSHASGVAGDGLDADPVLGGLDFGTGEGYRVDGVVATSPNGTW
jgi:hypothetical protein